MRNAVRENQGLGGGGTGGAVIYPPAFTAAAFPVTLRPMFGTVELPLWVLVLVLLFAAVTALDRVIGPSARWYFRRRMEKAVARLNERLAVPIQPFKLARRHDMIQRLIYDPKVAEAVSEAAREEGIPQDVAFARARRYAREIVPSFSAAAYFGFAIRAASWLSRTLYRVRLGSFDQARIDAIDPDATVIFVMNHRSNMDYVLVTFLAAERSALSFAVGEWARVWPLQQLIRAMGAYFIRRRSRNTLYRRVLARYVQLATEAGVTQAVFPEGGLSLDGSVGEPRLGLLKYLLSGFNANTSRDIVFVPVALNYDRVLEDRVLLRAARDGTRRFRFSLPKMLGFIGRQIRFKLTGRFHRFGYAAVSFGTPLSLRAFQKGRKRATLTETVAAELMRRIRDVVPVLPVPLVATVLLRAAEPLSKDAIMSRVEALMQRLQANGAHVHVPRDSRRYAAEMGLNLLVQRHMVRDVAGKYSADPAQVDVLGYYAGSIAHLVDAVTD